ncbi:MAG: NAD(P)/FAD-dependent oxidoreductase [Actinobacteria bacterium]|jgi:prolycopene isomerase|nr:MAG: NAD(P)/FAD-dependent oxidoreductase [Actinomycetota bacterium]
MSARRVIVIGSGPGGSAFGALMAHAGHHVTILERNGFSGGKCSSLPHGGYVVDTGVHMFGRGPLGPFGEVSRILGVGPRWSAATPAFTLSLSGGHKLEMASSIAHPVSLLNFLKGHLRGWQRMGWTSTAVKSLHELGPARLFSLARGFNDRRYPLYGELQDVCVRDFFSSISDCDDFLRTFHAQAMLTMVLPWHRASMGEFAYILASTMRASRLCYPRGGSGAIPASFLRALERRGGEIRLGCEVASIEIAGGRARGVITAEGEFIPGDTVVSSAGLRRTIELAGRDAFPAVYVDRADGLRDSEAFIAVKFFLDRKISSIRTPCLLHMPGLSPHGMFDYLEDGSIPAELFLFVTAPGRWDPSLVPPGGDCLIFGVPAPSRLDRGAQAEALLDLAEEMAAAIFPEISAATVAVERIMCTDVSCLSGRISGDCIGIAQEVGQSGSFRPRSATPVDGLFLAGADAGGRGIGTEMAADSALRLYWQLKV